METTVLSMLVDAVREVKETVGQLSRDLNARLGDLPNAYVPRQEVRQWVDDLIIDHGEERSERKTEMADERAARRTEIAELRAEVAAVEERRRSDRWQTITAVLALTGLGLTALTLIIMHWK